MNKSKTLSSVSSHSLPVYSIHEGANVANICILVAVALAVCHISPVHTAQQLAGVAWHADALELGAEHPPDPDKDTVHLGRNRLLTFLAAQQRRGIGIRFLVQFQCCVLYTISTFQDSM